MVYTDRGLYTNMYTITNMIIVKTYMFFNFLNPYLISLLLWVFTCILYTIHRSGFTDIYTIHNMFIKGVPMQNIYGFQLFESISIYNFSFFVGVYMYPILLNIQRSRSIVYTILFMISGGAQNYTVYMMLYNV